jgi:hypothetical protein
MTPAKRQQLEERLSQLDDAILTLRRGFARRGERPPEVCSLMQEERNDIARLLSVEQALDTAERQIAWTTETLQRTPPLGTRRSDASIWGRAVDLYRSLFPKSDPDAF